MFGEVAIYEPEDEIRLLLEDFFFRLNVTPNIVKKISDLNGIVNSKTIGVFISLFVDTLEINKKIIHEVIEKTNGIVPIIAVTHFADGTFFKKLANEGVFLVLQIPFNNYSIDRIFKKFIAKKSEPLDIIFEVVVNTTGMQLTKNNLKNLNLRLRKRMNDLKITSSAEYFKYFRSHIETEMNHLITKLTTHTTSFFRESSQFDYLYEHIYPKLFKLNKEFKIWSAACSTGEEVYSIVISLLEFAESNSLPGAVLNSIKVVGSDIDPKSIANAKKGIYNSSHLVNLTPELISKYFDEGKGPLKGLYRIKDIVYSRCEFRDFNLLSHVYPLEEFEVIFIRHALMYFNSVEQKTILRKIQDRLSDKGYLFLSFSEGNMSDYIDMRMVYPSVFSKSYTKELNIADKVNTKKIRTIVVDDSPFVVKKISEILSNDKRFEIVATASNPVEAMPLVDSLTPDLMTLDINMPVMDGLTYLEHVRKSNKKHPHVVLISSVDLSTAEKYFNLDQLPFYEFVEKPSESSWDLFKNKLPKICYSVVTKRKPTPVTKLKKEESNKIFYKASASKNDVILIGSSTGGVDALSLILPVIPSNTPPIVVAQHMPPLFTTSFAMRLNNRCEANVVEIKNDQILEYGNIYICPGGKNVEIHQVAKGLKLNLSDNENETYVPSANKLFNSALSFIGEYNFYPILLTGMGDDGALGMQRLHEEGCFTMAQDEETSIVYGMPKNAFKLGAVDQIAPLTKILPYLFKRIDRKNQKIS